MTFQIIYAKDLVAEMAEDNTILVDIRSGREYKEEHWDGALNLPLHDTDSYEKALSLDKRVILYCQHGGNSMQLARYLGRRGYKAATVIGGFETMKKIGKNYLKIGDFMTQ